MAIHGKNGFMSVNTDDVSTYLDSAGLDKSLDTAEVSTFGMDDKEYIAGLRDATFSLEGKWDATIDGLMADIEDEIETSGVVAFEYGPAGSTAGLVKYSGNAIMTAYNIAQNVNGEITFSASFQVTGGVNRGTFSA
jgi:predicted secreted protein